MKYVDLHTDALTQEGVLSVTKKTLEAGGCLLQCFAAFTPRGGMAETLALCDKFDAMCAENGYRAARRIADLGEPVNALLTVEGGGAIEGKIENLERLYARGVRLLTLTWNHANEIGSPHGQSGGLTSFGQKVLERMGELGMVADVSHGSAELFQDVAAWSRRTKIPFVASHSNAAACFAHSRNLSDGQIKTLADCGGVAGLCFFADFLSADKSAEGQREALLTHAEHIVRTGGEDVLAIGSDFDGIPQNAYMKSAADMPRLLDDLCGIFPSRVVEKIACGNALRALKEAIG